MAAPQITPLPAPPVRSDAPADFSSKADAFAAALPPMVTQENELAEWMNSTATQVGADAVFSGEAADRAEAVDTNVGEQVAAAQAFANNAAASALAAESAPGSIGNLALLHAVALSF